LLLLLLPAIVVVLVIVVIVTFTIIIIIINIRSDVAAFVVDDVSATRYCSVLMVHLITTAAAASLGLNSVRFGSDWFVSDWLGLAWFGLAWFGLVLALFFAFCALLAGALCHSGQPPATMDGVPHAISPHLDAIFSYLAQGMAMRLNDTGWVGGRQSPLHPINVAPCRRSAIGWLDGF
jgi:hypothetical protein